MQTYHELNHPQVIAALKAGGVGVIPTDTLYGVVASVRHPAAIERLYALRQRTPAKACIVLFAELSQVADMVVLPSLSVTKDYWPGPVSIVLPTTEQTPEVLHRGLKSLACRMPADDQFRALLSQTGPLLAPSANLEGQPPAATIAEAQAYFGDKADFYVDGGDKHGQPSKILKFENGALRVLRA